MDTKKKAILLTAIGIAATIALGLTGLAIVLLGYGIGTFIMRRRRAKKAKSI